LELSESDSEEEEEVVEEEEDGEWGKRKANFYSNDYEEEEEEEEEGNLAKEEEDEAKRLQQKKLASLKSEDFDDETPLKPEKITKKKITPPKVMIVNQKDSLLVAFEKSSLIDEVEQVSKDISNLTKEERLEIIINDSPELLELLDEFKTSIENIREKIQPLLLKIKNGLLPTSKGTSYLEVKLHLLLNYCINISFYLSLKAEGKSVKDHPVIDQLVKIRTIMEKLAPLDKKLKYQIDKLLKTAAVGNLNHLASDPKRFKPNLDALVDDQQDAPPEDGQEAIYKVDKRREVHFEDDTKDGKKKKEDKMKKKAASSKLMEFIHQEYSDKPEEIQQIGASDNKMMDEEELERQKFEEENFTRMILSKKDKSKMKRKRYDDELESLIDFENVSGVNKQITNDLLQSSKRSISQVFQEMGQKKKKNLVSGDYDTPIKERQPRQSLPNDDEIIESDSIESDEQLEEDPFYEEVKQQSKKPKKENNKIEKIITSHDDEFMEGEKRGINRAMQNNRGLTRSRNKKVKNPTTKYRHKHEQVMKKRKGAVRNMRTQDKPYRGEATGIKKNVVRSKTFK